jgi:hypothetical protein
MIAPGLEPQNGTSLAVVGVDELRSDAIAVAGPDAMTLLGEE